MAGVHSAAVKTGGQTVRYLQRIQAQNPGCLLGTFAGLLSVLPSDGFSV